MPWLTAGSGSRGRGKKSGSYQALIERCRKSDAVNRPFRGRGQHADFFRSLFRRATKKFLRHFLRPRAGAGETPAL